MKTLILDGNSKVFRAYCVAKNQPNPNKGEFLHIYIFLNSLKSIIDTYKPTQIICTWDERIGNSTNKRKDIVPEYKANRDSSYAKEVYAKNEYIKQLLTAIGIKQIFPTELEADDIIYFLSKKLGGKKVVITMDKDLLQTVTEDTVLYDPVRKTEFNISNIEEKLGYSLKDFVTYKAFKGDKSDNIEGIKGFGEKKIRDYINGDITLTEEQQAIFCKNLKIMDLSQGVSNHKDELDSYENQFSQPFPTPNWNKFLDLCKEMEFNSILNNKERWYETFFQKNILSSVIGKLFA